MFESDDWDLDQDFLNDVDEKATQFYSQTNHEEVEPVKRRKVESCNEFRLSIDTDVKRSIEKQTERNGVEYKQDKISRKNLILEMFSRSYSNQGDSQNESQNLQKMSSVRSPVDQSCCNKNSQIPRKDVVLGILQKKDMQHRAMQNNHCVLNNVKDANLQNIQSKCEVKDNISKRPDTVIRPKGKNCTTNINSKGSTLSSTNQSNRSTTSILKGSNNTGFVDDTRKQLIFDVLKPSSTGQRCSKNHGNSHPSSRKIPQVQPNKNMTMLRKFPGPAGLIPDNMDTSILPVSYLNSLEENETDRLKESPESSLSEYCSQNSKNLFTEGAWQLMLNNLPHGLLRGYEIATVKQIANSDSCQSRKVQFLAGILEYIDHSHDNPSIILKDFTDSIQGLIHRDISLKYPGLLEPNVVILLHDVGLLRTSGSLSVNKYCILISPSNLLGIYTNKGKIVRTCYMESALESYSLNEKTQRENHSATQSIKEQILEVNCSSHSIDKLTHSNNNDKDIQNVEVLNDKCTSRSMNESVTFNANNDFSFCVSSNEITNSQNVKNFSSPMLKGIDSANEADGQQHIEDININTKKPESSNKTRTENLLQVLKSFAANGSMKKKLSPQSKIVHSDIQHSLKLSDCNLEDFKSEVSNDLLSEEMNINKNDVDTLDKKPESFKENLNTKEENIQSNKESKRLLIRSNLLGFRSKDVSTPPESSNVADCDTKSILASEKNDRQSQNKQLLPTGLNSFRSILSNSENDSDDEMLSQLDVDTIFSNYNNDS